MDDIAMYLSLRWSQHIDMADTKTGFNVFCIYMLRKDVLMMHKLMQRGSMINYLNRKNGFTHLRQAIEMDLPKKIIKWLIKQGANPHIMDYHGRDSCDAASSKKIYKCVKELHTGKCEIDPAKYRI